jgi:hypothetical protein
VKKTQGCYSLSDEIGETINLAIRQQAFQKRSHGGGFEENRHVLHVNVRCGLLGPPGSSHANWVL